MAKLGRRYKQDFQAEREIRKKKGRVASYTWRKQARLYGDEVMNHMSEHRF